MYTFCEWDVIPLHHVPDYLVCLNLLGFLNQRGFGQEPGNQLEYFNAGSLFPLSRPPDFPSHMDHHQDRVFETPNGRNNPSFRADV